MKNKTPIEILMGEFQIQHDDAVLKAVQKYGEIIKEEIINEADALIKAWSHYSTEPFMQAKVEGGDLILRTVKHIFAKFSENINGVRESNEQ